MLVTWFTDKVSLMNSAKPLRSMTKIQKSLVHSRSDFLTRVDILRQHLSMANRKGTYSSDNLRCSAKKEMNVWMHPRVYNILCLLHHPMPQCTAVLHLLLMTITIVMGQSQTLRSIIIRSKYLDVRSVSKVPIVASLSKKQYKHGQALLSRQVCKASVY